MPIFNVLDCDFGMITIAGSHLGMATNILDWCTVDHDSCELTCIIVEIHCAGVVMVFVVFGQLGMRHNDIIDKNVAGSTADIVNPNVELYGEWSCWGCVGDVLGW